MSANSAELPAMPVAARTRWTRLAILAALLIAAFAFIVAMVTWLAPALPSRTVTYDLAGLEVGVPEISSVPSIWVGTQPASSTASGSSVRRVAT